MTLPKGFLFTQNNLQDFIECQRRFQLRHILRLAWPAVEVEPFVEYEHLLDQGLKFHKIVRQHLAGIPEAKIEKSIGDNEEMHSYWRNYLHSIKDGVLADFFKGAARHYEEIVVSTPINEYRLVARFDVLIICQDDKLIILDWKTSQKRPTRKWLAERLQTRVYPYVLSRNHAGITSEGKIDPSHVEMIYWFSNEPDQPERFSYSTHTYQEDEQYITSLASTISQKSDPIFPLTPELKLCLFCNYRSLCDRGVNPGSLAELEAWQELESSSADVTLDYEQVGEIEF